MNNEFNLKKFCQDFRNDHILLPDFQRTFKWRDIEKQQMLVSSVLAKIPIGSILLLEGNSKDFKAKNIGLKPKAQSRDFGEDKNVKFLIDGQQRMTVLVNAFSNDIFLQQGYKDSDIENSLKNRFFLKLDYSNDSIDDLKNNDLFGLKKLKFPYASIDQHIPDFTTNEVIDYITTVPSNDKDYNYIKPTNDYGNIMSQTKNNLIAFCTSSLNSNRARVLIPLFALCNNSLNSAGVIKKIIGKAKDEVVERYVEAFIDPTFAEFYNYPLTDDEINMINNLPSEAKAINYEQLIKDKAELWVDNFLKYLETCITELNLAEIIVPDGQRGRAINIYEMLNKGGVSLSVYDLVIASVAKKITDNTSFDQLIRNEIESNLTKPIYDMQHFSEFVYLNWNPQEFMEIIKNGEEISPKYINVLLNLIALNYTIDRKNKIEANVNHIKRSFILDLPPEHILTVYKKTCMALNRALYILQTRCGLLNINSLNYEHVLLVMSFLLQDDAIYQDQQKMEYLCAWYWLVNFSGEFNESQSQRMVDNLNVLLKYFYKNEYANTAIIFNNKLGDVFNNTTYSSKELILLENAQYGVYPKKHLIDLICQYVISDGKCRDLIDHNIKIQAWNKTLKLEKHHILPLGSYVSYDKMTKAVRNSKDNIINSPINYMYLTDASNKKISNDPIQTYMNKIFMDDVDASDRLGFMVAHLLQNVYQQVDANNLTAINMNSQQVNVLLNYRYNEIKNSVKTYINDKMHLS